MTDDRELQAAEGREIAYRIREELARRRMSRQGLADAARISISTLEKVLSGKRAFTLATVIRLEEALGTRLRETAKAASPSSAASLAPDHLGAYVRPAVKWIEGDYLTLRPSFRNPDAIFAYVTSIQWDEDVGHLIFQESRRTDPVFEQRGQVSMPHLSGHVYLVTNDDGQMRLTILGRPTSNKALYGILTTLQVGAGSQLVPMSCPVALVRTSDADKAAVGIIAPDHSEFEGYRQRLAIAIDDDFAHFRV